MTFQDDALLPWASAADNLVYVLAAHPTACARIPDWLARFEVRPGLLPAEMSGGMRRRLSLARAFAAEAAVLLLDEPFAFLDAGWRVCVVETIDAAVAGGVAVLFSTHQSEKTPRACRRSITLENGRIAAVRMLSGSSRRIA